MLFSHILKYLHKRMGQLICRDNHAGLAMDLRQQLCRRMAGRQAWMINYKVFHQRTKASASCSSGMICCGITDF